MMALGPDTIDLWWLALDGEPQPADLHLLDAHEHERAARFRFAHHRHRFVIYRAWLRRLLGLYLDLAPASIEYRLIANDKPVLATPAGVPELHFNLSHSDSLALCALSRVSPLGVDVERQRVIKDHLEIAARHFGPAEFAWVCDGDEARVMARFFAVWTRKEAFIKATGEGLSRALDSFDVVPQEGGPVAVRELGASSTSWYVQALSLDGDAAAALCSRCPHPRLVWRQPPAGSDRALRPATR